MRLIASHACVPICAAVCFQEGATTEQINALSQFKFRRTQPSAPPTLPASSIFLPIAADRGAEGGGTPSTEDRSDASNVVGGSDSRDEVRVVVDGEGGGVMTQVARLWQSPTGGQLRQRSLSGEDAVSGFTSDDIRFKAP